MNIDSQSNQENQREEGEIEEIIYSYEPLQLGRISEENQDKQENEDLSTSFFDNADEETQKKKAEALKLEMLRIMKGIEKTTQEQEQSKEEVYNIEFPMLFADGVSYQTVLQYFIPQHSIYMNTPQLKLKEICDNPRAPITPFLRSINKYLLDFSIQNKKYYYNYYQRCTFETSASSCTFEDLQEKNEPFIPIFSKSTFVKQTACYPSVITLPYKAIPQDSVSTSLRESRIIKIKSKKTEEKYHTGIINIGQDFHDFHDYQDFQDEMNSFIFAKKRSKNRIRKDRLERKKREQEILDLVADTKPEDFSSSDNGSEEEMNVEKSVLKRRSYYRKISHGWRTLERRLSSSVKEEGQLDIESSRLLYYKRKGTDLKTISKEDLDFIHDLNKRHQEKWNQKKKIVSSSFLDDLKKEMLDIMKKEMLMKESQTVESNQSNIQSVESNQSLSPKSSQPEEETNQKKEISPWTRAEQQRLLYKQMKTSRRRVVIPYQPSPTTIIHSFYPSNVYLKYQFVIPVANMENSTTSSQSTQATTVKETSEKLPQSKPSSRKRQEPSYSLKSIPGYLPIKIFHQQPMSFEEQQALLPAELKKEMEESSNIVLQLRVRIQRTKDECNHLEKQIQETEQLLINDQKRHSEFVANLHKRIEMNKLKKQGQIV